ncbi:acyl-CoA desaturase [Streptomyces sp. NBC_01537]|uniref:acyl-CoA desaturase n=1 Tax=Streptomyces sp. NBC_01537 TaxID=2903896 RepID=UPI003866AF67
MTLTTQGTMPAADYDGTGPFPADSAESTDSAEPQAAGWRIQAALTGLFVVLPFAGLAVAVWLLWGHGIRLADVLLAVGFYALTGLGVTVGFHRLITHRSFTARRWLRTGLAVAGSMSFQGNVIDWVAVHRQHHAFTDRPGDPHSPHRYGTGPIGQLRGLAHAHLGWLFRYAPTSAARYAPDLLADPAIVRVARAFPALCAASLLLPALAGWAIGGNLWAALTAFLWAGLVRILLLQHVTWSVNSLCHMIGTRPYASRRFDRSTDLWPLSLISFGESWHNGHHSAPTCARHGVGPHQIDLSAGLIRVFERLGWATAVHWPAPERPLRIPEPR